MHTYQQSTGRWFTPEKKLLGIGYSGHGAGTNNPEMQEVKADPADPNSPAGPLPCGMYTIGTLRDSARTGRDIMDLKPDADNEMFGRGDFECHGDSVVHPHQASHGCIIQLHSVRLEINKSTDRRLKVVP